MTKTFFSDARGNLVSISNNQQGIINFQFDNDNNMVGAEANGTNWTFRYNSQNQMYYSKIVDEYDSVIDERFYIYDGLNCIAETETDGTILREYIRIGNTGGIVAEIRHNDPTCSTGYQSGTFYYHYNHRGDVIAVSSHNGGIVFKADYDAYGKTMRLDSGTFAPRYTFSTKRYFSELGLYYYGYRWYIPELGRWTTKDPIDYKGGTLNIYRFCGNNPLDIVDKYGLCGNKSTVASTVASILGKIWNSPNTAIGLIWGGIGMIGGADVNLDNNAIQFENHPLMFGAITLGNTISYANNFGPNTPVREGNVGNHERQHTIQGEILGPLYLPANAIGGAAGLVSGGNWHAPANFMERGPLSKPPKPW